MLKQPNGYIGTLGPRLLLPKGCERHRRRSCVCYSYPRRVSRATLAQSLSRPAVTSRMTFRISS